MLLEVSELLTYAKKHYKKQLPFVIYHKPNDSRIHAYFQKDKRLHIINNYKANGFIFASFHHKGSVCYFPKSLCEHHSVPFDPPKIEIFKNKQFIEAKNSGQKERYKTLVTKAVAQIRQGAFKKVVVSRKEIVKLTMCNPFQYFENALKSYPDAMTYIWFHPEIGLWIGATPETLVQIKKGTLHTMALAGTQAFEEGKKQNWGQKELKEQEWVTNFILDALQKHADQMTQAPLQTHRAGSLLHLKTDITVSLENPDTDLASLISSLHPTPAVCGLPRKEALDFIIKNEGYDREYYTGFLGELNGQNLDEQTHLFVNLRCMKLDPRKATIYVGGGITEDSVAKKEWEETVRKTSTMKQILSIDSQG